MADLPTQQPIDGEESEGVGCSNLRRDDETEVVEGRRLRVASDNRVEGAVGEVPDRHLHVRARDDAPVVDLVDEIFMHESRIAKTENLSSITVKLPAENTVCPGVYYYIFKELAWDNINIAEVISTTNEFTVVIGDADIHRAFTILMEAKRQATL